MFGESGGGSTSHILDGHDQDRWRCGLKSFVSEGGPDVFKQVWS